MQYNNGAKRTTKGAKGKDSGVMDAIEHIESINESRRQAQMQREKERKERKELECGRKVVYLQIQQTRHSHD
ncbi:hypothetical protein HDU80_011341 [Chytriomyces hyalinus]|nr:hypothetical protein HDU80_011341 [Chytriomyces hyalinus]